jgi:hypothetical protein
MQQHAIAANNTMTARRTVRYVPPRWKKREMVTGVVNGIDSPEARNPIAMVDVSMYEPFEERSVDERENNPNSKSQSMGEQMAG